MIKIYKLLSKAKQILFALVLTVFSGAAYSQTTYTFNYTGSIQTINLQAGSYSIQCWGAKGESAVNQPTGGIGGYSAGTYIVSSPLTAYIAVGGKGSLGISSGAFANGGYNGGGQGYGSTVIGAGGGGASHVATVTGTIGALASNTSAIIIVAGGGGGSGYAGIGGNGGGATGGNGNSGTGGSSGGTFGVGANGTTAGTCGGGGGGWFGGNLGSPGNTGGAGGGSGYIGGISGGITVQPGQTGFVTNPIASGDGLVLITELCSFALTASSSGTAVPATLCAGSSLTITTNAISNYSWSTGATTSSLVVAPTTNTVYSLTATSPSNCVATVNMSVIVSSGVPVLTLAATPASVCVGDSVKLNATGAVSYTWSNGVNNNQLFPPSQTTTYVVTGKNGCGTTTAAITVTALPLPVLISGATHTICSGSPLSLTVTGATNYTWSTSQTGSLIVVAPTGPATYSVLGKKGSCVNTNSYSISTNPLPIVQLAGTATMLCAGNSVTLTASGGNNYTWTPNTFSGTTNTDTPTTSINYKVSGSNSFGCINGASYIVIVNPLPTITVNSSQPFICPGASVDLTAAGGHTYTWNTGAQTKTITVNPSSTTQYTVTGSYTTTGCQDETYFTVNVDQPTLAVSASQTVCPGTVVTMSVNGSNPNWSNGGTTPFIAVTVSSPTMYTVNAKVLTANNLLCDATGTINLGMSPQPVVAVTATRSEICRNEKTVITASGANTYLWMNTNQTGNTQTFSNNVPATYIIKVEGTDANGCRDTSDVSVKVNACLGLVEGQLSSVSVFPNPSSGKFTVKSEEDVVLQVLNELGQLVREIELNGQNQHQVNVSGLSSGIYFLRGKTVGETINHKLIVE